MKYGTSGFRDDAKKIINISFKIGVIVAYLTVTENDHFGIMITASHNKYLDNDKAIIESLSCFKRAGADGVLTYFALEASKLLKKG